MPDAGQLLTVFACFEKLYTYLESDWSKRFAERMGGAGGLELVVEVAHDFRSPLTSILFLAETLKHGRSGPVTPLQERQLGLIYSAAFGLSGVASDVVELARGGDRLVELEPTPFSLADIFESVRDITEPIAVEKGLEIRLVPPESDLRIGHPVALSRVLLNLSTNALKFTDEGVVEVGGRSLEGDALEFWVQDSGRGIPASVDGLPLRALPPPPASRRICLLRLRPRPLHLPQAGRGDGWRAEGGFRGGEGNEVPFSYSASVGWAVAHCHDLLRGRSSGTSS